MTKCWQDFDSFFNKKAKEYEEEILNKMRNSDNRDESLCSMKNVGKSKDDESLCYKEVEKSKDDKSLYYKEVEKSKDDERFITLVKGVKAYISLVSEIDKNSFCKESTFMVEESSETIVELAQFIKNLCKFERKKASDEASEKDLDKAKDEAIDILVTILVFLKRNGVEDEYILKKIGEKSQRTIENFVKKGEI